MPKGNASITLIGVDLARSGTEFVFNGPANECEMCKLKNTCLNLDVGRRYRIVTVRGNMRHDCALHDIGVKAVEVVESPSVVAIDSKNAFVGSRILYKQNECEVSNCKIYELCHPNGLVREEKYTISEVLGDTPDTCPEGKSLKLVELKR
ncbi:MAG: UPF0179 family protein [Halobacteriota archaeon]|jgi:hypothetical protein